MFSNIRINVKLTCTLRGGAQLHSYYPGWHAYVDGNARILAAQLLPSGRVEVRAGKHRVRHAWQLRLELRLFFAGGT